MRIAVFLVVLAAIAANAIRPVHAVLPKRNAGDGLILRSQAVAGGASATLDPDLLSDLPRIRPNARGAFVVRRDSAKHAIDAEGTIADSYTGGDGAAVFAIVRGQRIANARTVYRDGRFSISLPASFAREGCCISVGLIAADERGYFRLDR